MLIPCKKCNSTNWSFYTSSSSLKQKKYCKTCRQNRAIAYSKRKTLAQGTHTEKEWLIKLVQFENCPGCSSPWSAIPLRPDKRYKRFGQRITSYRSTKAAQIP